MQCCLFTGVTVLKRNGEHVIPDWMQRQYALSARNVEMGETERVARIMEFRAPADPVANGLFGRIEEKVKLGSATADELHLWSKKISVGMIWNHYRLAMNINHPRAPDAFDSRHLSIILMDFHEEFAQFKVNSYKRSGSTLILPTKIEGCWFVHTFGANVDTGYSETHDAIAPFGFLAASHHGKLVVSALYDSEHKLESGRLMKEWVSSGLHECMDDARIRAGLAVIFAEEVVAPSFRKMTNRDAPQELLQNVAYQMGIIIEPPGPNYRRRVASDSAPSWIVTSRSG